MSVGSGDFYSGQAQSVTPSKRHFAYVGAADVNAQLEQDQFENNHYSKAPFCTFDYSQIDRALKFVKTINQ